MANFGVMEEFTDKGGETVVDGEPVRGGEYWGVGGRPGGSAGISPLERRVVFVKTLEGKHDYIGVQEGLQDIIGRKFGLFGPGAEFRSEEPLIAPPSSATVPVPASPAPSSVVDVGGSDTSEAGGWSPPPSEAGGQEWTAITKIVD